LKADSVKEEEAIRSFRIRFDLRTAQLEEHPAYGRISGPLSLEDRPIVMGLQAQDKKRSTSS
jgi:hypothetical protein